MDVSSLIEHLVSDESRRHAGLDTTHELTYDHQIRGGRESRSRQGVHALRETREALCDIEYGNVDVKPATAEGVSDQDVITAVYRQGALHPLEPLELDEDQRVRIQVFPDPVLTHSQERGLRTLREAGLLHTGPLTPSMDAPMSESERQKLADRLGESPGKATSEMVIEDRGTW